VTSDDELNWHRRGRTAAELRRRPTRRERSGSPPEGGGASPRLTVADRVQIARGAAMPQAVCKILKFRRGQEAVRRTLAYVLSKADWAYVVEGDAEAKGKTSAAAMLDDWKADFTTRANGRDVMHMEVSAPPGSDRDTVFAAARAFAAEAFEGRQYALAEHRDTKHPHCHLVVKLKGDDGRSLNPRKADLARWRERFAHHARANGLALEASSRAARGVGRKGVSQPVYQLRRRGVVPGTDAARAAAAIADYREGRVAPNAFEAAQAARNAAERRAFAVEAKRVKRAAEASTDDRERDELAAMARDLAAFAQGLPAPKSERQLTIEAYARAEAILRDGGRDTERSR
jgi:hypothetical protein